MAVAALWYGLEFEQFGTLQWNRNCDNVVGAAYFFIIWWLFHKNDEWVREVINIFKDKAKDSE